MAEAYRPFKKVYTLEEIKGFCMATNMENSRTSDLISHYRPPFADYFQGREMRFTFNDGQTFAYRFVDAHTLSWSANGGPPETEYYEALESTRKGVYLIHHIRRGVLPFEGVTMIVDTETELATRIHSRFGTAQSDINVDSKFTFGSFGRPGRPLHAWTDELCGVVLDWKYSDQFVIRHEYVSTDAMLSPGEPTDDEEAYLFRKVLSASYVKIREHLYIASFAEDGGSVFNLLIDLAALRDVGAIFGIGEKGLSSYTIGAVAGRGKFGFTGKYSIS